MPFKSEKQRRFLWAEHPEIAKRWAHEYPESNKNLPMYADKAENKDDKDSNTAKDTNKKAASSMLKNSNNFNVAALLSEIEGRTYFPSSSILAPEVNENSKKADSKQEKVDIPHTEEPTYAGEEREKGMISSSVDTGANMNESCGKNAINELLQKLSVVLAPSIQQTMENLEAEREGRVPVRVGKNRGLKQYPQATPTIPLPMGMQQPPQPQQTQQAQQKQPASPTPVGAGQSSATTDPIKFHSGLSASGIINGNAALSAPNTVNTKISAMKPAAKKQKKPVKPHYGAAMGGALTGMLIAKALRAGYRSQYEDGWDNPTDYSTPEYEPNYDNLNQYFKSSGHNGNSVLSQMMSMEHCSESEMMDLLEAESDELYMKKAVEKWAGTPAWQRAAGKNDEGGLNAKGRASYNRETGGNLKAPVTEKNPTGERDKRQNSFCSRMCGMKKHETGSKTKKDPDSRINKALRKWNCKCSSAQEFGKEAAKRVLNLSPSWGGQKWQLGEWGLNPQVGYRYLGGVVPTPDIALRLGGPLGGTAVGLAPFPYVETDWGRPSGRQANKEMRSLYKWIGDGMRDRPTAAAHALANVPEDAKAEDYEAAMRSSGVGYSSKELKRLAERMAKMGPLQLAVE